MAEGRDKGTGDGAGVEQWYDRLGTNWFRILLFGSAALLSISALVRFAVEPYHVSTDSALFQHAGWYIANGATPYVDFWDIKPPLIYAVTTGLALLSGGNMAVLHLLSVALASGAVVAGVTLVGVLTHRLTDHGPASVVAGATMFVLPTVYVFPSAGIRPKYFAFAFGIGALVLAVDDHPTKSGAAAAASAGFWQLGGLVALLAVGIGLQRGGPRAAGRTVGGGVAVAIAVVAPFVAADLAIPLFLETVLAPLYTVERYTVGGRILEFVIEVGYGAFLLPIGLYGWIRGVLEDASRYWWVGVGGAAYLLQVFLEMQGAIELIFPLSFLAIGVGVVLANPPAAPSTSLPSPSRSWLVAAVAVLAVLNVLWAFGPVTPIKHEVETAHERRAISEYETVAPPPENAPSMRTLYWEKGIPESCHYRAGYKQRHFVERIDTTVDKPTCGQWPFEEPPRAWVLDSITPG
jgi:hypothetical protein